MRPEANIVVLGAGIIGISTALELQKRGFAVLVIDRDPVGIGTSSGNAGGFAFSDIEPLATPGIIRKAPKWLLDPLGPLSIPPRYAFRIAPWMMRFWRASWRDRSAASAVAQAALMAHSRAALERQISDVEGEDLIERQGQLNLYEGAAAFRRSKPLWEAREAHGIPFAHLTSPEAIAEIQPGLDSRFTHAAFSPTWMNTVDPRRWLCRLAHRFEARGGQIMRGEVQTITPISSGIRLIVSEGAVEASRVIISAGAWSHHLARQLGHRIPLETERGYNTTLPAGAFDLRTFLTFGAHGFVVSPINGGIRVGGAVELGGLDLPPNYRRAEMLLTKARSFLPGLKTEGGTQWMGYRPSLPDSLPVIDRAPGLPQVIYAFGHGHLGLTQSAGTAELVADLVMEQTPAINLTPLAATRF
ncbi:NAD(P)/FAD-dependent oxidoreductase [Palleronia caenipelagi]|uniref:FAD-binding oxidoreductase n=1 Tax=Palleronia caenipelagi TaxID=2489174 RepID=A0A547Q928_9RHOB|nr:FAD-binding oxidoreductase [Palleronia caenipelagi]TRD22897.1 FAD-binding oxidoreductase [Palleronia caenipelagi]